MLYYGARYNLAPEGGVSQDLIAGGVIAAGSSFEPQLRRRGKLIRSQPYLQRRVLDPQLYLATLQPSEAPRTVARLATYPWMMCDFQAPEFLSSSFRGRGGLPAWFNEHKEELRGGWRAAPPSDSDEIRRAIVSAVAIQGHLECESLILPSPMTTIASHDYGQELTWLDIGLEVVRQHNPKRLPVYATIAISDTVLRNVDPAANTLLELISDQISSRPVAGVYLVLEQASEQRYVCRDSRTLESILTLVDDLTRGAGKRVIVNYLGPFGLIAVAAGASVWTTGYYLSQRRLKLADMEPEDARAWPRFYSAPLAGDIGLGADLDAVAEAGLLKAVWSPTNASAPLYDSLSSGGTVKDVEEWLYRSGNKSAAAAHYLELMQVMGSRLQDAPIARRVELIDWWLTRAVRIAEAIRKEVGLEDSSHTDLAHQQVWLDVFHRWKRRANM